SDRIAILSFTPPATLAEEATISVVGGPEGLVFDGAGARAYTNAAGFLDAIDVAERRVIGHWRTGCGGSHGFPVVDDAFGLVFAGCSGSGGAAVLTTGGESRAGF